MVIQFIYDPSLKEKKEELNEVVETATEKPIPHNVLFLRRFIRAVIFHLADTEEKSTREFRADRFRKMPPKELLPEPPRPITKMVPVNH